MDFSSLSTDVQLAIKHAIAVSWYDDDFASKLRDSPHEAFAELGYILPCDVEVQFD
jgi:hypothetical protein